MLNHKKAVLLLLGLLISTFSTPVQALARESTVEICGWVDFIPLPPGGQAEYDYSMTLWGTAEIVHLAPPFYTEYDTPEAQRWADLFWSVLKQPGYYRIYDPVRDGAWVTLFAGIEKVGGCEAPQTPAPSETSTVSPLPRFTDTAMPPADPPAPDTRSNLLELPVTPIRQRISPPVTLSNGMLDSGTYDCFIASMAMALEYYKKQNILDDQDTTNYQSLILEVRGTVHPGTSIVNDPAFVAGVTHNKLSARPWFTTAENLATVIETELRAGRPVVAGTPDWSRLAARWPGRVGHSILVYGLHDGEIFYIDPWGGGPDNGRYRMSIQDFILADTFEAGSFVITFERIP
jgi:uncharacterized protein YvpB